MLEQFLLLREDNQAQVDLDLDLTLPYKYPPLLAGC